MRCSDTPFYDFKQLTINKLILDLVTKLGSLNQSPNRSLDES
jgi:hypothetical protein